MKQPGDQQAGRDIFNINEGTVTVINQLVPQRSRSESLLLQAVKQELNSRLDQSLHKAVFLNLGKQSQPQQVKRLWDAEIKIGSKSPVLLPTETTILEVFDHPSIVGRLLILGKPGAGKTTTMLDLAKALCDRAEQDAIAFIPVLVNLSSWKGPKQAITAWLVEELKSKYGVRKDIGTQWLADKQLLPLLDGLDEVHPEHQEGCVRAINRWLKSEGSPPSLAVCCRREEYELYSEKLIFNGAIYLQELSDSQIEVYLQQVNQSTLWQVLATNVNLLQIVRQPLLLNITLLAYREEFVERWQALQTTEEQIEFLLDIYVQRMLTRKVDSNSYKINQAPNEKKTSLWLAWLALQLQRQSQQEFLIERMQPSLLPTRNLRRIYYVSVVFLIVTALSSAVCLVNVLADSQDSELYFYLIGALIIGLGIGLHTKIEVFETLKWSRKYTKNSVIGSLIGAGISFIIISLTQGFGTGISIGILNGFSFGLLGGLSSGLNGSEIEVKAFPNQGIRKSVQNALAAALISGLAIGVIIGGTVGVLTNRLTDGANLGVKIGLSAGLIVFLITGGTTCLQHFILRLLLYFERCVPWNYARFLNYATEKMLLQRIGGRYKFIHRYLQDYFVSKLYRLIRKPLHETEGSKVSN